METQQKQDAPSPPASAPAAAGQSPGQPVEGEATTGQRLLWGVRRPVVPAVAIALLALICIFVIWATTPGDQPAEGGTTAQKSTRKPHGKADQEQANLRIPRWMIENDNKPGDGTPGTGKSDENKNGGGKTDGAPKQPPPTPRIPPEPPRFLANRSVSDDISWNHPNAVGDNEIASKGWEKLSAGQRAWVIRRTRARALAYRRSLVSTHEKFIARIWPIEIAVTGQRQFLALDANLRAAVAAADGQLSASYEAVDAAICAAKVFVEEANASWLEFDPVTLPEFEEKPNSAWLEWHRRYGGQTGSR